MLDENYIVEKSKALVWADMASYNFAQLRFLDVYLSKINARNPEHCKVVFTKTEYCDLAGIDERINTKYLDESLNKLMQSVVTFPIKEGFKKNTLFSEAICQKDPKTGRTIISIECNNKVKDLFFNISEDGYIRYKLKNMLALSTGGAIILYNILKDAEFRGKITIDLAELKKRMAVKNGCYPEFKDFNKRILKPAVESINEHTDIRVEYVSGELLGYK